MIVRVCEQFLGLPWHPAITKFISDHMRARGGGHRARDSDLHTTSLDSRLKVGPHQYFLDINVENIVPQVDQWRSGLRGAELKLINSSCSRLIQLHEDLSMFN